MLYRACYSVVQINSNNMWTKIKQDFIRVEPRSDSDRAAQFMLGRINDKEELRRTYRAAPDLFDSMDHPRLNYLFFLML